MRTIEMISTLSAVRFLSSTSIEEKTDREPRTKIPAVAILRLAGICNFQTAGMGKIKIPASERQLAEFVMAEGAKLTRQRSWVPGFQNARIGVHWVRMTTYRAMKSAISQTKLSHQPILSQRQRQPNIR